jgi:hypothetical protein
MKKLLSFSFVPLGFLILLLISSSFTTINAAKVKEKIKIKEGSSSNALLRSKLMSMEKAYPGPIGPSKLGLKLLKPGYDPMDRPNKGKMPDIISVGIKLLRVDEVSDIKEEFKANVLLKIRWKDQRLAGVIVPSDSPQLVDPMQVWTPGFALSNTAAPAQFLSQSIKLFSDGTIQLLKNINYAGSVKVDVHYFPFDVQNMELLFECPDYDRSQLQFIVDEKASITGVKGEDIWKLDNWSVQEETRKSIINGQPDSYVVATAKVRRLFGMTCATLVAPLYIIGNFCFMAFFVYIGDFSSRVGIVSTGFLTLIAFFFVINENLPKISYLTWLHHYCALTTLFVLYTQIAVVVTHFLDPENEASQKQHMSSIEMKIHLQEAEQDVQLAKEGSAHLEDVNLTDDDWEQHEVIIAAGKAFDRVDHSKNGQLDSKELLIALNVLGVENSTIKLARSIISKYSFTGDEDLDAMSRAEFITYVLHSFKSGAGIKDLMKLSNSAVCCGFGPHHAEVIDFWSKVLVPPIYTIVTIGMLISAGAFAKS